MHSGPPSFTEAPWAKKNKEKTVRRGRKGKERKRQRLNAGRERGRGVKMSRYVS